MAPHALRDHRKRTIEPYRDAVVLEQLVVAALGEGASAQRHHHRPSALNEADPLLDCGSLNAAELLLAARVEDLSNGGALLCFDVLVNIDERPAERVRQSPANGRFSGGHKANQVD